MTELEQFNDYQQQRYQKLADLRASGHEPYPARTARTHTSTAARALMQTAHTAGQAHTEQQVTIAGRVVGIRFMGKAAFISIEDGGGQIQFYLKRDTIGEESYTFFKKMVDLGDFVEATGPMFITRTGEETVETQSWAILAKAINQPPEKWHGLTDVEQRYRQRYVDLLSDPEVRDLFITRAKMVSLVRQFMERDGYIECETPILQPLYGGGAARPFVTHHNYAKRDLYLRIADELYLKRLIVGGLEKVYEIGKDFRNEGISLKHNPEFTMIEAYQAYADYTHMMSLTEQCFAFVAQELCGTLHIPYGEVVLDLTPPWQRLTMQAAILEHTGIDIYEATTLDALQSAIAAKQLRLERKPTWALQVDELFSELVEPHLIQPIFLMDYPRQLSPLAKQKADNPQIVERFEFFMAGRELGNAFSELNDPIEQLERFKEQQAMAAAGDADAHPIDDDYVTALLYGMPPTGGIGWGIDRMAMIFTNQSSIREVILFPQLRPES